MEAFLRKYDKDCMKMVMLKHEQVFKQQVHELHRLYRIQKLLMKDITSCERKDRQRVPGCSRAHLLSDLDSSILSFLPSDGVNGERRPRRRRALDLQLPADEYIVRAEEQQTMLAEVEQEDIDVELALSIGNNNSRKREEAAFTHSDSSSFSSSSTESGGILSLNGGHEWRLHHQADDVHLGHRNGLRNSFGLEEGTGDEGGMKKSPSWFLECLSFQMS